MILSPACTSRLALLVPSKDFECRLARCTQAGLVTILCLDSACNVLILLYLTFLLASGEGGPETLLGSLKVTQQLEDKKSKLSRFKDKLDQGPGASPPSFPSSCALAFLPVTQEKCI